MNYIYEFRNGVTNVSLLPVEDRAPLWTYINFTTSTGPDPETGLLQGSNTICPLSTIYVDADVHCDRAAENADLSCTAKHIRNTPGKNASTNETVLDIFSNIANAYPSAFQQMPCWFGSTSTGRSTSLERYLADPAARFLNDDFPAKITDVPMDVFTSRLTLLWNTYWKLSLDASLFLSGNGPSLNASDTSVVPGDTTGTWTESDREIYKISKPWFTVYWVATAILTLCAVIAVYVRTLIRSPDILGSVSSFMRGAKFLTVPDGGSALDGAVRARLLKDKWVRLQDVQPREEVGRIAFSDDSSYSHFKLEWSRRYE